MILIILVPLLGLSLAAAAQDLSGIFEGKIVPREEMVETYLMGSRLEPYHLTEFHSVRFFTSDEVVVTIADLVMEHAGEALEKETVYAGGKLVYAILVFRDPEGGSRRMPRSRFICFQVTEEEGARAMVTLVEMKGTARLDDLKSIFGSNDNE